MLGTIDAVVEAIDAQNEAGLSLSGIQNAAASLARDCGLDPNHFTDWGDDTPAIYDRVVGHASLGPKDEEHAGLLLADGTVADAMQRLLDEGASSNDAVKMFVAAGNAVRSDIEGALAADEPLIVRNRITGKSVPLGHLVCDGFAFLARGAYVNYLRLAGITTPPTYDTIHRKNIYAFSHAERPSSMTAFVMNYPDTPTPIIHGKRLCTIGPGAGRDEISFVAEGGVLSIDTIEISETSLRRFRQNALDSLTAEQLSRIRFPAGATDMFDALHQFSVDGQTFDTFYLHSVSHYFDRTRFARLCALIHACLSPGGYIVISEKTPRFRMRDGFSPGARLDGIGIPLVRTFDDNPNHPTTSGWLHLDGFARFFRPAHIIKSSLRDIGFMPWCTEEHYISDYDARGTGQMFSQVIAQKASK